MFLSDSFVMPANAKRPDATTGVADGCGLQGRAGSLQPRQGLDLRTHRLRSGICSMSICSQRGKDWSTDTVVGSLTHGVVANDAWKAKIDTALGLFLADGDMAAFQSALVTAATTYPKQVGVRQAVAMEPGAGAGPPLPYLRPGHDRLEFHGKRSWTSRERTTATPVPVRAATARPASARVDRDQLLAHPGRPTVDHRHGIFVYGFIGWNVRVSFTPAGRGLTPEVRLRRAAQLPRAVRRRAVAHRPAQHLRVNRGVRGRGAGAGLRCMAFMLDRGTRGESLLRSIYLFPMALSFIATGIVWRWLLDNGTGAGADRPEQAAGRLSGSRLPAQRLAPVRLHLGHRRRRAARRLGAVGVRHGAVPGRDPAVPEDLREAARMDGASETAGLLARDPAAAAPGAAVGGGHPGAHLAEELRPAVRSLDQRNLKIDTPSLYMWFTTFDGGFLNRGATIATLLLIGVALVVGPYIWYSVRTERSR